MKHNLQIHIPTPCHENWDAMTPENKGRFCGSCAKTVVDFSVMTDNEVLHYLQKNTGNTCGHFTADQLQRPIIETQLQPKKTWRYCLASIASLLVLMQKSSGQTQQDVKRLKGDTTVVLEEMKNFIVGKIAAQPVERKITGTVVDEYNNPIIGASILIKNSKKGTVADEKGRFSLMSASQAITIVVSAIGYNVKETFITANSKSAIKLTLNTSFMGEVVIVRAPKKQKIDAARTTVLDTLSQCVAKVFKNEAFTIYPNPVSKNGTINILVKEAGMYELQVLNNQSSLILTQQYQTVTAKQVIQIQVPSNIVQGINYVRLVNKITHKQWVDKLMIR